ncbi:MAG: DUF2157 domain-containing protein [Pirellulaceae bacterium]|nr:DUF2157 domain-containing protein [Pirellulaceae bacterium]
MSRFLHKLSALLNEAAEQQVIDSITMARLREMAEDRERSGGVLSLVAVLGWLGAAILGLGVILLISANWDEIPSLVKLLGFFVLFAAVNSANLHLRRRDRLPWFAEALSFLGAVLFMAGVALISQIYQVEGRPPTAVLIWLIAIAPLAWCFRSPSVTLLSLLVLVLWLHMEQFNWSGPAYRLSPASVLMIEVGVITRFFDLMGGLFQTGLAFVVGGAVLLATCFAVEYWRRGILWQLKQADQQRPGAKP